MTLMKGPLPWYMTHSGEIHIEGADFVGGGVGGNRFHDIPVYRQWDEAGTHDYPSYDPFYEDDDQIYGPEVCQFGVIFRRGDAASAP